GDELTHVVFSGDGRRLASASRDGTVRLWDVTTTKPLHVWQAHPSYQAQHSDFARERAGVKALDLTPDGRWLLAAGADPTVALLDATPLHWPRAAGADQLKLWDTATGKEVRSLQLPDPQQGEHALAVFHARLGPDGTTATVLFSARQFGLTTHPTSQLAIAD